MDRHTFTYDTEARELHLQRLIDARIYAAEADILAGRKAVIAAVAEKTGEQRGDRSLNCDVDEAEALVRAAVLGRSVLVGERIAEVVELAIYAYVLPLAQADLAAAEKARDDDRIARVEADRVFA